MGQPISGHWYSLREMQPLATSTMSPGLGLGGTEPPTSAATTSEARELPWLFHTVLYRCTFFPQGKEFREMLMIGSLDLVGTASTFCQDPDCSRWNKL